jgi:hypothetical protein
VSIVSNNPETLDGLQAYLREAGVACRTTSAIRHVASSVAELASVAVIFPDDFDAVDVDALLYNLRRHRPKLFALIVTRDPNRYRSPAGADGKASLPVVLPKPSFGWVILDAIRAHAAALGLA